MTTWPSGTDHLAETQPSGVPPISALPPMARPPRRRRRRRWGCACGCALPVIPTLLLIIFYLLAPGRTTVLLLGIDTREPDDTIGRSDTNLLVTFKPIENYVGLLSIPRDLWVAVPGYGENRINAAHFFGEAEQPPAGPTLAMETVGSNFGLNVDYYIRLRFAGLSSLVDALGGVTIDLENHMSGYPAGRHRLTGEEALAFVRDRAGTDDFFRMERGQLFFQAVLQTVLSPQGWFRLPALLRTLPDLIDTDIPFWLWPRLGFSTLRAGTEGLDTRVIGREMVIPFTTAGGAAVLAPNWEVINPVLLEMFEQ
jgi:LCP family protein required for cell wall assembly